MAFDNKLTNARGANSSVKTIFGAIEFEITNISNPSVTVRNADQGSSFIYNQTLALGQTSSAKRMEFNNPLAQLFTFDARIYGNAFAGSTVGNGSSSGDGTGNPPTSTTFSIFREEKTGTLLAGDPTATIGASATWGNPLFKGITWDDFEVTTRSDAQFLEASLNSLTAVDLDFELRTVDGQVLASSAGITASEFVSASVQPNTTYILRVLGFANAPAQYTIISDQLLPENSPNQNTGTRSSGGNSTSGSSTNPVSRLVRFTVNPLTRRVTTQILQ